MATAMKSRLGWRDGVVDPDEVMELERPEDRNKRCRALRTIVKESRQRKQRFGFTLHPVAKAAMTSSSGTTGGYAVPKDYNLSLFDSIAENSFVAPRAHVVPMTSATTLCPKPDSETQGAAGVTPFFGGLQFTCGQGQGLSLVESEPKFDQLALTACDLIGQLVVSNQFIEDIGDAGELALVRLFGKAIAWYWEWLYFRGTGASNAQPLGMVNAGCAIQATRASGSHIIQADVVAMAERLLPSGWSNAVWAINPKCIEEVMKLTNYQPNESHDGLPTEAAGYLFSRPLFVTDKLPTLGTPGDIIFFDPSLYVIGVREDVLIEASPHPLFTTNQTVFRVWARGDGKPFMSKAATTADNSANTVSQIVLLAA